MKKRLFENFITFRVVSESPIDPDTNIADLSYLCCTHFWALQGSEVRSRLMTGSQVSEMDRRDLAMLGCAPHPTEIRDPAAKEGA